MQRLIAFGCSITFGDHMPDVKENSHIPSKLAWPQVLGDFLKYKVDNRSTRGCSNFEILHNILNYKFKSDDCVIIMWSFTDRDMIFKRKLLFGLEKIPLGMWQNNELSKKWEDVHSKDDIAMRTWYYIHHASLYLQSMGINYYNVFVRLNDFKKVKPANLIVPYNDIKMDMSVPMDYANDQRHPGPITNFNIACRLKQLIKVSYEN